MRSALLLILFGNPASVLAGDLRTLERGVCHRLAPDSASPGLSERRAAIVIGNGAYQPAIGSLYNGPNDAVGMTSILRALGFEVIFGTDLSEKAIDECLSGIRASKESWDLIAFHYSGHGIQINDENYLVGVDTAELTPKLVGLRPLQPIIDTMQSHATAVLVFLDACRNNPFASAGQQGLSVSTARNISPVVGVLDKASPSAVQARGLFVAYATSPNAVASDGTGDLSPFTEALISGLSTAGWSIQRTLSQVTQKVGEATQWGQTPWSKSSLTSEVKLNGRMTREETLAVSEAWTRRSIDYLDRGLRDEAIAAAVAGLPLDLNEQNKAYYAPAYLALYDALSTIRVQFSDADNSEANVFSPDRKYVTRSDGGRPYQVWDVKNKTLLFSLPSTGSGGGKVEWSPDSATVAIVTGHGFVSVARVPSGEIVVKFNGSMPEDKHFQQYAHVENLNFDETGQFLLSAGGFIDPIKIFDTKTGRMIRAFSQNELRQIASKGGVKYIQSVYAKLIAGGVVCAGFSSNNLNQNVAVALLSVTEKTHRLIHSFRDQYMNNLDCTPDAAKISVNTNTYPAEEKLTVISISDFQPINVKSYFSYYGYFNKSGTHMAIWKNDTYQYMDLKSGEIVDRPGAPDGHIRKSWGVYSSSGKSVGYVNQMKSFDVWSEIPDGSQMVDFALNNIPQDIISKFLANRFSHPANIISAFP